MRDTSATIPEHWRTTGWQRRCNSPGPPSLLRYARRPCLTSTRSSRNPCNAEETDLNLSHEATEEDFEEFMITHTQLTVWHQFCYSLLTSSQTLFLRLLMLTAEVSGFLNFWGLWILPRATARTLSFRIPYIRRD